jgi:general nucleoside transport system ATP-binding protein
VSIEQPASALAVEMRGITKRFPGVLANDTVDFGLRAGEVHALLGENGAGKSTLMNILAGLYRPDSGDVLVGGIPHEFHSPRDAIAAGLGMVHQHFTLVPSQSVTENILLGLDRPRFRLNLDSYEDEIAQLSASFGLRVEPRAKVWQLSVGEQQRVEILKMLYRGVRILIMDEPTAVLAPQEIEELFRTLRAMTASGRSVVFISHKLNEVTAIADRITVMRRGKVTAAAIPGDGATRPQLAQLMVGRTVIETLERGLFAPGDVVLSVRDLETLNDRGLPALRGVSFDVRAGEILGIAGVAGNGQSELAQVITGLRPCRGHIQVDGSETGNRPSGEAIRHGVAHVPEDRTGVGSAPNLSVTDNLIMKSYRRAPIAHGWVIDRGAARRIAENLREGYQIVAPSIDTAARLLSGGNLQRLILAREIDVQPRLLVAVQPTRGLDVGAIEGVHKLLLARRDAGAATVMISEDLDEVLALSDRVAVLYEGRLHGPFDTAQVHAQGLGLLMTGGEWQPGESGESGESASTGESAEAAETAAPAEAAREVTR